MVGGVGAIRAAIEIAIATATAIETIRAGARRLARIMDKNYER